jgi:hypothetical protein
MRRNMFVGAMLLVVAVMAVGCAKPPQQEIDAAKAALTAAEQAEAPKYAAGEWDKAQQLIVDATNAANAAKEAGIAGKEKAKTEAQAAIDAVKGAVTSTQEILATLEKCRRKPKDMKKDLEMMKGNLDGYAAQITDIDGKFAREDFFGAKAQADSLKGQVEAMATEMTAAKTKIKC